MSFWLRAQELVEDAEAMAADSDLGSPPPFAELFEGLTPPTPDRLAQLRAMDYRTEYLRSQEWAFTRRSAIAACGHRCQGCDEYKGLQDVHHVSYKRLGQEEPEDLIVLCRECHTRAHEAERA